ncbi:DBF4-type zinc finger-containing protein 2 isoform X2 [Electrophorus electricus]|nr:DBF4-type zinc finger-containing protein 2 isoform X2 [Electrophorus electricus]
MQTDMDNRVTNPNRSSREEQPVAGPSNTSQRQGFCGCCQILYNSVEQHILSTRHREALRRTRAHVSCGSLMERFLQDVLQHHPHRYTDTQPTHADLPCLSTLPVPREELSEIYCGSDDGGVSVGTREEMPSSDDESCQTAQPEATVISWSRSQQQAPSPAVRMGRGAATSAQTAFDTGKVRVEHPPPEQNFPTLGFLHRTSGKSTPCKPHTTQLPHTTKADHCQIQPSAHPSSSKTPHQRHESPQLQHRKAHRKTNRHRESSDSNPGSPASPDTTYMTSEALSEPLQPRAWTTATSPWKEPHRKQMTSEQSDQIQEVIEDVIVRHCYGHSPIPKRQDDPKRQEDEGSFHISLQSIGESKDSEEWDTTMQVALEKITTEDKYLACLTDVHVNLEDQEYENQLTAALNTVPEIMEAKAVKAKENTVEDIIPDLPHIPQSFIGKTWAQVMFEDDLKVEGMVREFRQGRFLCYFDSESLAKFGKHCRKGKKCKNQEKVDDVECKDVLPLMEHNEEDPNHSLVFRKTRQRIYRMASRCQVVKVSHGTQTAPLSCPVVRRRTVPDTGAMQSSSEPQRDPNLEQTPDMKTRLCALKLPASYCRIMTPVQPRTVVYVLSSPDAGQGTFKPTPIKRIGRKRKSGDEEYALKYKYKKTPLKYYDPLTNRILKTPPKGMPSTPTTKCLSHVRQLFRSLSPDINKEHHGSTQRRSPRSSRKGGSEGSMADLCASTSGSCLDNGGPSEPSSSMSSSRKALFSHSSISSSSRFLLGQLMPTVSHTDSSSRASAPPLADSNLRVAGCDREQDRGEAHIDQLPVSRRLRRQGVVEKPLTPPKKPSSPGYRSKRKSARTSSRAKPNSLLQQRLSSRGAAGSRVSTRNRTPTRASPRSAKLAVKHLEGPRTKAGLELIKSAGE